MEKVCHDIAKDIYKAMYTIEFGYSYNYGQDTLLKITSEANPYEFWMEGIQ